MTWFNTFPKQAMKATKEQLIAKLLANSVYQPESGLYRGLERALSRLSTSVLSNLDLLVSIKVRDAEGK